MSEMRITRDMAQYSDQDDLAHRWTMTIGTETLSTLWVFETGEIMQVETPAAHQGNGYASALYRAAAAEIDIFHAPAAHRTPAGDRFARSVGGASTTCQHGCCDSGADFDED